jgi:sulfate adenylyltransferase
MISPRKNKSIHIDTEALSSLALVKAGLITPVTGLMNEATSKEVNRTKEYKGVSFPFSFILAPSGKKNHETLKSLTKDEIVDIISENKKVGELIVDETFLVDANERIYSIYGTNDKSHPGVRNTSKRLGSIAVSGEYTIEYQQINNNTRDIKEKIKATGAKKISGFVLAASPINRSHERIVRQIMANSDLLVIFLHKPFVSDGISYDIRHNALMLFIDNFLPRDRVIVVPFENTYIFAGYNELILDALLAKNYGCKELIVGKNHGGLGLYYDNNKANTVFDRSKNLGIKIITVDEYVYCDICNTLVSTETCPHGAHHHVNYHSHAIRKLLENGIVPPTILVRKEISALILANLFPNRFQNIQELYSALMPNYGLIEEPNDEQFYIKLVELYQTSSLT